MNLEFRPLLPWAGKVLGYARAEYGDSSFIVTEREEAPCFVVLRMEPGGACHGGEYLDNRQVALSRMIQRAGATR